MTKHTMLAIGAAVGISMVAGASTFAVGQFNPFNTSNLPMKSMIDNWAAPTTVGQLASNEGIFVDVNEFKINKGIKG
jgi:hypothetical protein